MKKLFNQLMPYLNRKYYHGLTVKWLLADIRGYPVTCICCGNIANMVGEMKLMGWLFRLPFCKSHVAGYMNIHHPEGWSLQSPGVFKINLRYSGRHYIIGSYEFHYTNQHVIGESIQKIVYNPAVFMKPMHNGPLLGAGDVLNDERAVESLKN